MTNVTNPSDHPLPLSGGGYVQHPNGRLERVQAPTAPAGPKSRPPSAALRPRPIRPASPPSESPSKPLPKE